MDYSPILISLKTASLTIAIVFVLGTLAAYFVIMRKKEITKVLLDGIFTMPLVLPPTVAGFFLLYLFGSNRPLGRLFFTVFHTKIAFSWGATVLAAVVIAFPLMYRAARGAFEQVDQELIQAGRTLGMSEFRIFLSVIIPNSLPGMISGAVLAFARGLGEFGATAMIAGNIAGRTRTLPLAVYSEVAAGDMDDASVYVAIIVGICFLVVVLLNIYQVRVKKHLSR